MKVNLHTPLEEIQVPIIPMIDVIFCILTFFLIAALQFTRHEAINVDLPKANTGTPSAASLKDKSNILLVTIDAVGQTYIDKILVKREELQLDLQQYIQTHPSGTLVLNASRAATYNDVIQVLDVLRQVGGDRVSLGIIPGSSQPAKNSANPANIPPVPNTNLPAPGSNLQLPSVPNQIPPANGLGGDQGLSPINPDGGGLPAPPAPVPVNPGNNPQSNFNPSLGGPPVAPGGAAHSPRKK